MDKVAVISFPGNNCEVESMRSIRVAGMEPVYFRWNDDVSKLTDVSGYFIPGGFSYEDRGRSGMVAARDPLMAHLHAEAEKGKTIIGNCNGAQILVESGLVPLDKGLRMSLARNAIHTKNGMASTGFLSEWIWITRSCEKDRCATSDWDGVMHLPIAHGEGRFTTNDPDVIKELQKNKQIAFSYCDSEGNVSEEIAVTPNGSMYAIAGICNPAGNVVALMPHPERTAEGDPYFASMKRWIEQKKGGSQPASSSAGILEQKVRDRAAKPLEIFIDTKIVNNEERTVEQAARRVHASLRLKQLRYLAPSRKTPEEVLQTIALFNPNKEIAYVRRAGTLRKWNSDLKCEEELQSSPLAGGMAVLRRDNPDVGAGDLGKGSETGICYVVAGIDEQKLCSQDLLEVFANPHASTLERLV